MYKQLAVTYKQNKQTTPKGHQNTNHLKIDHSCPRERRYSDHLYHKDLETNNQAHFCNTVSLSNTHTYANSFFLHRKLCYSLKY
jgi:hypothetical protein